MAEVLVLVDHVDGKVRKTTSELLTIARRLGEPSAVFVGTGFDAAKETLAEYGAEKVYRVESRRRARATSSSPQAELLAQLVADDVAGRRAHPVLRRRARRSPPASPSRPSRA